MAEYIEREAFIAEQRHLYCENCDRRRGMKDGKLTKKFVRAIGDAPCRACDIGDMLDSVEDYPAADVAPVVRATNQTAGGFLCSACSFGDFGGFYGYEPRYCPNCGAKMDKDGDGE